MSASTEIPQQMRAQFLDGFNKPYELRETSVPKISSPHDLLIKVGAASYCHTDHVLMSGEMQPNPPSFPHVGSHEFAGRIVAMHSESSEKASAFKVGERLGVPGRAFHPCGSCFECSAGPEDSGYFYDDPPGYSVNCLKSGNNGISAPGGFREYAVVDARQVTPLPDEMDEVNAAPLMCAGVTIYAALKRCNLKSGQRVGIMGCGGGLGHLGLQFAVAMGLKVLGVDAADKPLSLANVLGLDTRIVDARAEEAADIRKQLGKEDGKELLQEMGLDAVIILPESQKAFDYGLELLKNHGKLILVSFPKGGFHLDSHAVVFRDISITGSLVGSNRMLREMIEFAAKHKVKVSLKRYPLASLNKLVEDYLKAEGGKLVVDMSMQDEQ